MAGPYIGRAIYVCLPSLLHPYSRGTVTLQSTDPYDPPLIDPNYFEDPRDVHDMVEGKLICFLAALYTNIYNKGSFA